MKNQNYKKICIQMQLERAPKIDLERVQKIIEKVSADKKTIRNSWIRLGNDKGFYINFIFEVNVIQKTWLLLKKKLYKDKKIGLLFKRSTIATSEGNDGWKDHVLLYHFKWAEDKR